jgi:hypothetical protein
MKRILSTLSQKWPEYLLEILVLIIGIYGAFALDNWNEETQKRKTEKAYLASIHDEFIQNKAQFDLVISNHVLARKACLALLEEYDLEKPNKDSLTKHQGLAWKTYTFNPSQSSIQSLVSSTSFDIIQNRELRQILIGWKDLIADYQESEYYAIRYWQERIRPFHEKIGYFELFLKGDPNTQISSEEKNILILRINDLNEILEGDQEREKVESAINRIIELTQPN